MREDLNAKNARLILPICAVVGGLTIAVFRIFDLGNSVLIRATAVPIVVMLFIISRRQRRRVAAGSGFPKVETAYHVVARSREEVRSQILKLVEDTPKWELSSFNPDSPMIQITTRAGLRSMGEIIEVQLRSETTSYTRVEISSSSLVATTIFDFGKNRVNVSRIAKALTGA